MVITSRTHTYTKSIVNKNIDFKEQNKTKKQKNKRREQEREKKKITKKGGNEVIAVFYLCFHISDTSSHTKTIFSTRWLPWVCSYSRVSVDHLQISGKITKRQCLLRARTVLLYINLHTGGMLKTLTRIWVSITNLIDNFEYTNDVYCASYRY